jgi:MFS transporter, DHA1 family, inner membrane transport protein
MTAFSLAAIAGVPAGVLLGARFTWAAPFVLLVVLSLMIGFGGALIVPPLDKHLNQQPPPLRKVLPDLARLLANPRHLNAFALTFMIMVSHMLVIPFIAPMLVLNHGVPPAHLSWMYMGGGCATFFTSRAIGRLADRYGKHLTFRIAALLSMPPVLFITHLPDLPFIAVVLFFPFFMVAMSGRMVPMQALLTTVPETSRRGAFLSANSALQALGAGCGAWIGGLMLTNTANGHIAGYGAIGWLAVAVTMSATLWVGRVKAAEKPGSTTAVESIAEPLSEV